MRPSRAAWLLAALALDAGAAMAAPAASDPTDLEGVVAVAPRDPKVVDTFPKDGTSIPSGVVILKIVFDQRMIPEAWSYGKSEQGEFPECLARPRLLNDQKSFALLCTLPPGKTFAIEINAAPGFVSAAGRSVQPRLLRFSTADDVTRTLREALTRAGLTDADAPIMDWNNPVGVSSVLPPPEP